MGVYLDFARRTGPNLSRDEQTVKPRAGDRGVLHKNEGNGNAKEGKKAQHRGRPSGSQGRVHFVGK